MANNVHFHVTFDIDEKESKLLEFLMENVGSQTDNGWVQYEIEKLPIYPNKYDEEGWYNWGIENMGAKWCHVEDYETDYFSGYSAWSPPIPFVKNLVQYIHDELGGKPTATMTYEDEFRNFIGVDHFETYHEDGEYYCSHSENYIDGDELTSIIEEEFKCDVSDGDFEWWEEYKDTGLVPQECLDEMVYDFFDTGELKWVS